MTHIEKKVFPKLQLVSDYEIGYQKFVKELNVRGYIQHSVSAK